VDADKPFSSHLGVAAGSHVFCRDGDTDPAYADPATAAMMMAMPRAARIAITANSVRVSISGFFHSQS
jgi:hypothetical protein